MPLTWSLKENLAWQTEFGGLGWSSPIVWGDRIFLTATTDDETTGRVLCIARDTGKILWDKTVADHLPTKKRPKLECHPHAGDRRPARVRGLQRL